MLIMRLDMSGYLSRATSGTGELGVLTITRKESLDSKSDTYTYTAIFAAGGWETESGKPKSAKVTFKAKYSNGALHLVQTAIRHLIRVCPELKAGRYGVPRNRAKCRKCGTVIWSKHTHDFTRCRCGAIALDGGYDYVRFAGDAKAMQRLPEPWQKRAKGKRRG